MIIMVPREEYICRIHGNTIIQIVLADREEIKLICEVCNVK